MVRFGAKKEESFLLFYFIYIWERLDLFFANNKFFEKPFV